MFENIGHFFKRIVKTEPQKELGSKDAAKERLHLVLMQDRANVSADFLELMKQEIIDVIKKYIVVDEESIDVRLTNQANDDGTNGAPALYANIPIVNIKNDMMAEKIKDFEGVDFNREMGIPMREEQNKENVESVAKEESTVIELQETYTSEETQEENEGKENRTVENNERENDEQNSEDLPKEIKEDEENEEIEELFEEVDDDDDDDVTFDDLLKAAEAAEQMSDSSTEIEEPKDSKKNTGKGNNKTKDKRKKKN